MTERHKRSQDEAAGKNRIEIGKLDLNKETTENLTEEQAEGAKGGGSVSSPALCKCCSGVVRD